MGTSDQLCNLNIELTKHHASPDWNSALLRQATEAAANLDAEEAYCPKAITPDIIEMSLKRGPV